VAYAATGTVDAVEDGVGGFLVQPGNLAELTAAVRRLINDPDLTTSLGRNGREFVKQHFSKDRVIAAHADLMEALVDGPARR
jgi:glycosyltransferase involved in cell wall biosynthesis